jgi:hypothetical protein
MEQQIETQTQQINDIVQKPKSRWLKYLAWILGPIILVVISIFLLPIMLSLFFGKDISAVDYPDLRLETRLIPENENAFIDLNKIDSDKVTGAQYTSDYFSDKTEWDQVKVGEIWNQNKVWYGFFDTASTKDKFQSTILEKPEGFSLDRPLVLMNGWRTMSRVSALRAIYLSRQNDNEAAIAEALKSVKIGTMMEQSQADTITYLVGLAIEKQGLDALKKMVSKFSKEDMQYLKNSLNDYNVDVTYGHKSLYKGEFETAAASIELLSKGAFDDALSNSGHYYNLVDMKKNNFYFKPNLTKSYFAEQARNGINTIGNCNPKEYVPMIADISSSGIKLLFTENAVGKVLVHTFDVSLQSLNDKVCNQQMTIQQLIKS